MSALGTAISPARAGSTGRDSASGVSGSLNTVRHTLAMARRNLMKIRGDPGLLLDATVMPMVFALMFVYVLGGAIAGSVGNYREFFMPGIMALTITIVSRSSGIGLAVDFNTRLVDRFRALPIARSVVLSGRIIADCVRMVLSLLVILAFALAIGFRIHTGVLPAIGALGLLTAFGFALAWVSAFIGLSMRSMQTVSTVTALWMVPLQFGSSLFVSAKTLPGSLQAFVRVNPMTLVVNTSRGLLVGGPVADPLRGALAWIAAILLVFVPLSVWRYVRRP
jgi:oleandomycin transport system permease protein